MKDGLELFGLEGADLASLRPERSGIDGEARIMVLVNHKEQQITMGVAAKAASYFEGRDPAKAKPFKDALKAAQALPQRPA